MGIPQIDTGPMTVAEFYAFTDGRPDEEKWELIDGEAVLNASPSPRHQLIAANVLFALILQQRERNMDWVAIPGIGALVSPTSRPEPDAMILPKSHLRLHSERRDTENAMVLFEIMSPSTASRDLKWKREAYARLPALLHYVVIAQDAVDVVVFSRANRFAETRYGAAGDVIAFAEIGATLNVRDVYRDLGLLD